jgi:hypothetical protein
MLKHYSIAINYKALLENGGCERFEWYKDVQDVDALEALNKATALFWSELLTEGANTVEIWDLKAHVTLASDVQRQEMEELLPKGDNPR